MSAAGLLYRYHDKWWGTGLICQQETRLFVSLSLTNVATGFLLWLGGIAGGAIALVVEGLVLRCGPKRPLQQKPDPIKHLYKRKFLHFSAT